MRHARLWAVLVLCFLLCGTPSAQAAEIQQDQEAASVQENNQIWLQFDANGGSGKLPERVYASVGEQILLPNAQLSVSLGGEIWRFAGWALDSGASVPDYRPGSSLILDENLTLYAVYTAEEFTVTYRIGNEVTTEEVPVGETPAQVPELPETYLGWQNKSGQIVDPVSAEIWEDQAFTAYQTIPLNTQEHNKYMDGMEDGLFHPDQYMTRAQAAQVLYNLLAEKPVAQVSYSDVSEGMWYTQAIQSLGALGVLDQPAGAEFRPDAAISRGEFAQILVHFVPKAEYLETFQDVPEKDPAYEAIGTVAAYGLFSGYPDGTFHPAAALTRAQAAVVLNHLLEREPDTGTIASDSSVRIFPDVTADHWAYDQIMEATVSHAYRLALGHEVWTEVTPERSALSDGYYRFNGRLYCIQNGMFLRSTTADGFTFDADGCYTTGSAALDTQLNNIVETYTNDTMSRNQKLRALYNYVRDNFSYLRRDLVSKGQTGWEAAYAEEFLRLGRGNCYSFSATFCLLARELGLPAYTVVGGLGASNSPHGWVEINLDGTVYMFDPQLEWRYLHDYGRTGYDLFMVLPSQARFTYIR